MFERRGDGYFFFWLRVIQLVFLLVNFCGNKYKKREFKRMEMVRKREYFMNKIELYKIVEFEVFC